MYLMLKMILTLWRLWPGIRSKPMSSLTELKPKQKVVKEEPLLKWPSSARVLQGVKAARIVLKNPNLMKVAWSLKYLK